MKRQGPANQIPDNVKEACYTLRKAGWTLQKIADTFNISTMSVFKYADIVEKGIHSSYYLPTLKEMNADRRIKLSDDNIAEMINFRNAGVTYKELARRYGVSMACVQYWVFPGRKEHVNRYSAIHHYDYRTSEDDAKVAKAVRARRIACAKKWKEDNE